MIIRLFLLTNIEQHPYPFSSLLPFQSIFFIGPDSDSLTHSRLVNLSLIIVYLCH